jgi:hypothetical protein
MLLSFMRMQPLSSSTAIGFCVADHMTASGKVGLVTGLQLSIALAMAVVYLVVTLCMRCWRERCTWATSRLKHIQAQGPRHAASGAGGSLGVLVEGGSGRAGESSLEPLIAGGERGTGTGYGATVLALEVEVGTLAAASAAPAEGPTVAPGASTWAPSHGESHRRVKLITAATNYVLTAHTALTVATLKMLQCVWVCAMKCRPLRCLLRCACQ